ncbi:MAG: 3-phosphoshikimate 1-carboxyvinyltransferase [Rickettsiales bacterium]|nr:3-phosphoshikimate 1-carboxyvinyltransferase [Pseudomonadota bacterium]MDA0967034.1 3-phosphoshikimate 1-carboxyvinyltransferase [Pseudomonadota bacterium]MDG4542480.1 3-phosphoshikimate 1-carboxyvinyltransferase [Rickettsiales bacterium]MDG4544984.1 3-phosphoshikimate 1-carboxyvinyltransferase [Rickettsiales bacterium]MDG4547107.1 3-phosphoshikimate 1-carboxyvinyltransferase [Rickettsiales bacterium]
MTKLQSTKCGSLSGVIKVPGDKSISHRSLIFASQAIGTSRICGLLEGEDVIATSKALQAMGVDIKKEPNGEWVVKGVGVGGLTKADNELDLGNSGTGVRLLMGLVAPYKFNTVFTGDASLKKRPMSRVMQPLEKMNIRFECKAGGRLPLTVIGNDEILPITYKLPVASAQVKSAILLAGLNCRGKTTVIEPVPTRDHTELMLKGLGADISTNDNGNGGREITLTGYPELKAMDFDVPGDPSSAAFAVVAALIVPDSEIMIENVCINPLRTGLYDTLIEMGGDIKFLNKRIQAGEKVADLQVKYSRLKGVKVPASRAASMIDEYPILAVAAAVADGDTLMEGLEELRVKESDRLQAVSDGLQACGVKFEAGNDWLKVTGGDVKGGGMVETHLDHRIAMSFLILGMVAKEPIAVDDGTMINTSFPKFSRLVNSVGGKITV